MNFQTDQSNASYTETLRSTANLIGQFGVFLFLRWDKQPEIDCSEFEWQALAVSCMRCFIAKNRLRVCGLFFLHVHEKVVMHDITGDAR